MKNRSLWNANPELFADEEAEAPTRKGRLPRKGEARGESRVPDENMKGPSTGQDFPCDKALINYYVPGELQVKTIWRNCI